MQDEFRNFVIGAFVISLFAFLIISASVSLGSTYEKDISELEGGKLNLTGINQTLQGVDESSEDWKDIFTKQRFPVVTGVLAVREMFDLFVNMFRIIMTPITLFSQMATNVLGIPSIVINVIILIVIVGVIFAIWSLLKKGD